MSLSRANSIKTSNPILHFKKFEANLAILKHEVETYNKRENCPHALNMSMGSSSSNSKKLLKEMTQPKYHRAVVDLMEDNEKERESEKIQRKKSSLTGIQSLVFSGILKAKEQAIKENEIANSYAQLSLTDQLKRKQIQLHIRRKRMQLEKEWAIMETYRSENSIIQEKQRGRSKKQRVIIRKVMHNRLHSTSAIESCSSSRKQTFESEFFEFR